MSQDFNTAEFQDFVMDGSKLVKMKSKNVTEVTIPEGVTEIGGGAFVYCSALQSIVIPDSVTVIGDCTFLYCENLTIQGKTGSYIETYCKNNNRPFAGIS